MAGRDRRASRRASGARALPEPVVPSEAYTERYYRETCMGAEAWRRSGGAQLDPLYARYAQLAGIGEGEVVIDLGCGRGELLVAALAAGAARAVGVEYAEAAIALARRTLEAHGAGARAELHHGDARAVPIGDGEADCVTLLDVVEHLAPAELERTLAEARRVLRPGGRLLVHTMPNRTIYAITYRAQRLLWPPRLRRWPADPRNDYERRLHVNEQTLTSLRCVLRDAGFADVDVRVGDWMWTDFVPSERARRTYHRLARLPLLERLGRGDLWARAVAPA